jgi:ribosomal protein L37E
MKWSRFSFIPPEATIHEDSFQEPPFSVAPFACYPNASMALIDCPECGTQVSSAAASCPKCGFPIAQEVRKVLGKTDEPKPKKKPMSTGRRLLIGFFVALAVVVALFSNEDRPRTSSPAPTAPVEPGSQSKGWFGKSDEDTNKREYQWFGRSDKPVAGKGLSATPVDDSPAAVNDAPTATTAQGSIRNPEHTFGKRRAAVRQLCERSGGAWLNGMCVLDDRTGVAFDWRNGVAFEHTIMKQGTEFGQSMLREFRKLFGKEDTTVPDDGCKEWIWRNVGGRRYWVIVCPGRDMSSASARKLR